MYKTPIFYRICKIILGPIFKFRNDLEKMCEHYISHSEKNTFLKHWSKTYFIYSIIVLFTFGNMRIYITNFLNNYKNFSEFVDLKNNIFVMVL